MSIYVGAGASAGQIWVGALPLSGGSSAPVITSASAFELYGTLTLTTQDSYATPVSITANGIALTNLVQVSPTQISGDIAAGGYGAVDSDIDIVFTDSDGVSDAFTVTIDPPSGYSFVTLADAVIWLPGTQAGGQIIYTPLSTVDGVPYSTSIDQLGNVDFGGTVGGIPIDYYVLDSSLNYSASATATILSPTPDNIKPVITVTGGTTSMVLGGVYTPPTVTASDNIDGDISGNLVVDGVFDPELVGTQVFLYDVQDSSFNNAIQQSHTVVVEALDSTPTQFVFASESDAPLSSYVESNHIMVEGINTPAPISIVGGEYAVSGGEFTSDPGTVSLGDDVIIELFTSALNSTPVSATLTIGGVSGSFTATTLDYVPIDDTPNAFSFTDQTDVALAQAIVSAPVTVEGIDIPSPISVVGGEYSVNGGAYTASAGTVSVDDTVTVRVTSSGTNLGVASVTLTIGGVSDTFTVTTIEAVQTPNIILGGDNDVLAGEVSTLTSGLFNHTSDTLAFLDNGSEKYALGYVSDGVVRIPSNIPSGTYTIIVRVAA